MNFKILLTFLLLGMAVTACSTEPRYSTRYTSTPPASAQGRTCVATCQGNKQLCAINARGEQQQCQANNVQRKKDCFERANSTYRGCVRSIGSHTSTQHQRSRRSGCSTTRDIARNNCGNRYSYSRCRSNGNCDSGYRQCFKQCGGKVKATRVCYQNCDKVKR